MDDTVSPGAFMSQTSELGFLAATSLSNFFPVRQIPRVALDISLSAALLADIAKQVESTGYFRGNFQGKLGRIVEKAKGEYETVVRALEKVGSWKPDGAGDEKKDPPTSQSKRFVWALDPRYKTLRDFQKACNKSVEQVLMLKALVSLVSLQIRARESTLTAPEQNHLRRLKKKMVYFLDELRDAGIAVLGGFRLLDSINPRNATQIAETNGVHPEHPSVPIPSTKSSAGLDPAPDLTPLSLQAPVENSTCKVANMKDDEKPKQTDTFEMWQANTLVYSPKLEQSTYRFWGFALQFERTENSVVSQLEEVPASQEDIKAFMERNKDNLMCEGTGALDVLVQLPPVVSNAVYRLLQNKSVGRPFMINKWSIERILPTPKSPKAPHRFWSKPAGAPEGHILILRCERKEPAPLRVLPPPPSFERFPPPNSKGQGLSSSQGRTKGFRNGRRSAARIELTQQESEDVINDFLASLSALYDGVPVEERGAALKAIVLSEDDSDEDDDSDDDSSSVTTYLAND